jgi:hypothetical protein
LGDCVEDFKFGDKHFIMGEFNFNHLLHGVHLLSIVKWRGSKRIAGNIQKNPQNT